MRPFIIFLLGLVITAIAAAGLTGNIYHGWLIMGTGLMVGAAVKALDSALN